MEFGFFYRLLLAQQECPYAGGHINNIIMAIDREMNKAIGRILIASVFPLRRS